MQGPGCGTVPWMYLLFHLCTSCGILHSFIYMCGCDVDAILFVGCFSVSNGSRALGTTWHRLRDGCPTQSVLTHWSRPSPLISHGERDTHVLRRSERPHRNGKNCKKHNRDTDMWHEIVIMHDSQCQLAMRSDRNEWTGSDGQRFNRHSGRVIRRVHCKVRATMTKWNQYQTSSSRRQSKLCNFNKASHSSKALMTGCDANPQNS